MKGTRLTVIWEMPEVDADEIEAALEAMRGSGRAKIVRCEDLDYEGTSESFDADALDAISGTIRVR